MYKTFQHVINIKDKIKERFCLHLRNPVYSLYLTAHLSPYYHIQVLTGPSGQWLPF